MKLLLLSSLLLISSLAYAEPFSTADAKTGKALVTKNCVNCHSESFGDDGSSIYTREFHKVKTSKGLISQACLYFFHFSFQFIIFLYFVK